MTVKTAVKFIIQAALYGMAYALAMLPFWQFIGVVIIIQIAFAVGQVE